VTAAQLAEAVRSVADPALVTVLATLDRRATEPGPREYAAALGCRLIGFPAAELAAQPVPGPSPAVAAAVGTPSVAEAAALLAAGSNAVLRTPKRVHAGVTVAVATPGRP